MARRRWGLYEDEFPIDPDEEREKARSKSMERCTPAKLRAFILESVVATGKPPTLEDCKKKWGGILGVFCDLWQLDRTGQFPQGQWTCQNCNLVVGGLKHPGRCIRCDSGQHTFQEVKPRG
jgi:hypothetical protein